VWRDSQTLLYVYAYTEYLQRGIAMKAFPTFHIALYYIYVFDSMLYAMLVNHSALLCVVRYVCCVSCVYYTGIV
jgi:hypothetical protein